MSSSYVVFYKIATTCLLILVGYIARRMKILQENSLPIISKFLMYLGLPAYFIYHMQSSVTLETVGRYWMYPLLGFGLLALNDLFGYVTARAWALPGERATFRVLVGLPNWLFMALAVCEPLFGADGVRVVLLYNFGILFYVWTLGMTSFRVAAGTREILASLFLNTQTISLFIGLALALFASGLRGMEKLDSATLAALPIHLGVLSPVWETVYIVGTTALPLSIIQIGLLLGAPRNEGAASDARSVLLTTGLRLLAAPALTLVALAALVSLGGASLDRMEFVTSVIIMSMPAAALSFTVVEVHGGATRLAAKAILLMTLVSLLTAPLATWVAEAVFSRL